MQRAEVRDIAERMGDHRRRDRPLRPVVGKRRRQGDPEEVRAQRSQPGCRQPEEHRGLLRIGEALRQPVQLAFERRERVLAAVHDHRAGDAPERRRDRVRTTPLEGERIDRHELARRVDLNEAYLRPVAARRVELQRQRDPWRGRQHGAGAGDSRVVGD